MTTIPKHLMLLLTLCIVGSNTLKGQSKDLYSYQELSHLYYQKQKDSLKKAWICPVTYKEKDTQKKYKEIWDQRTEFFTTAITDDNYVYDREVSRYIDEIVAQITEANKQYLPVKPLVVLDRSSSVNAYAIGSNILAINVGLITFAKTREEIALTVAHELSHNILQHPENSMKKRAEWLTSEEYKKSINEILDSKYERFTRLRKVYENYTFSRNRHQRYHEGDADSLAIILLNNSHITFDPDFFMRMDSVDNQYYNPLQKPLKEYFIAYNITVEDIWLKKRSKGLSTKNYSFQESTRLEDSLKTHPDCVERYNKTQGQRSPNGVITPIPTSIKKRANKMLIWNMYCNMSLTPCLYRILLEKDKGSTDAWYDFMLHNIMLTLYRSDKEMHRFNAIGVTQKEYISEDYYKLQTMLEQIPRENLERSCMNLQSAAFWADMSAPEKDFKGLLHRLAFTDNSPDDANVGASQQFIQTNSNSPYSEFAHIFEKK